MSASHINNNYNKCVQCNRSMKGLCGKAKRISTEEEIAEYQAHCDNTVAIGSTFCSRCRLLIYRRQHPCESSSSSDAEGIDPDFHSSSNSRTSNTIELPFRRVVSTHKCCTLCQSSSQLIVIPLEARLQVFAIKRIYIPQGNRCCPKHIIKKRFYDDELYLLRIYSTRSLITECEVSMFLDRLAISSDATLFDKIADGSISEEQLRAFTGLDWDGIDKLKCMLTSMRNSESRSVTQALIIFLFKLRSGGSNVMIKNIFGLRHEQQVSEYLHQTVTAFEKDILPDNFGTHAKSRDDLILNETTYATKKLFDMGQTALALIFDGTYVTHQKSRNNEYQRKSYSGQKKTSLCKPFTICTTNGYIVDTAGPFNANMNDAAIMKVLLEDPNGISTLLEPGDFCFVDRGFRDIAEFMRNRGYNVLMPPCKGNRAQLTTEEANASRFVTKIRWAVEAVHGDIGQKYRLLHHTMDNKLLPTLKSLCRIASFLHNTFGQRLGSDTEITDTIIDYMKERRRTEENTLQQTIESNRLSRRKKPFTRMTSSSLMDFPELTERDLKILFTGTYQLSQAVCYLAEVMKDDNILNMEYLKEDNNIMRAKVRSRHINRKTYQCYIEYRPNSIGFAAISRYACDCANGNRTVGCCSHVAAIIYYLSHGRFKSKIIKPSEILTEIFDVTNTTVVINEDSDQD